MIRQALKSAGKGLFAACAAAFIASGCAEGLDVDINAPILEAAGINLSSKKAEEPDLPERAGIVMPPSNNLPEPGSRAVAAGDQSWPNDPDQQKKIAAAEAKSKEEIYCREGDWKGKGNIDEFDKTVGRQQRCRAGWVKDVIKNNAEENEAAAIRNDAAAKQTN